MTCTTREALRTNEQTVLTRHSFSERTYVLEVALPLSLIERASNISVSVTVWRIEIETVNTTAIMVYSFQTYPLTAFARDASQH